MRLRRDRADAPFEPRWTWRALRADRRRNRRGPAPSMLPCLLALAVSLFCFLRVFVLLGGVPAAAGGLDGFGADHGPVLQNGMQASVWMVFAAVSLGVAGVLLDSTWMPKVRFKRGALRAMLRAALTRAPPSAPAPARVVAPALAPASGAAPTPPPPVRTVDPMDVVGALARPPPAPRRVETAWLSADEAAGARALARLFAAA